MQKQEEVLEVKIGRYRYLDVRPFAFFNGRTSSIICAGGLGDVAFAGRHWDGDGDVCE